MRKGMLATVALTVALGLGVAAAVAVAGQPNNSGNKVTICHATGSATNPYVRISPDAEGVVSGHVAHQDQRDIIPPFDYVGKDRATHHFAGQNWTAEGQAIYANGCKQPTAGSPPPPPSPKPVTTVTVGTGTTSTQTVTVNVPTTGPTTTVRKVSGKRVVVVRKVHVRVAAKRAPRTTG